MTIAKTILQQLGGNKFIAMTGAKELSDEGNGLRMKLTRNMAGANYLTIAINSMDTYDMVFVKMVKPTPRNGFRQSMKTVAEHRGVYCDMLNDCFTQTTGLYTSL